MNTNYKFYKDHKFLVVDDDETLRNQAIDVLVDLDFDKSQIVSAINGKEALEILKSGKHEIEFFIVDLVMPVMNGIEFLKELSKIEKYKSHPKLVLSSEADSNIILNAIAAGANDYMNKPCDKMTLVKKLFDCVSQQT